LLYYRERVHYRNPFKTADKHQSARNMIQTEDLKS